MSSDKRMRFVHPLIRLAEGHPMLPVQVMHLALMGAQDQPTVFRPNEQIAASAGDELFGEGLETARVTVG
jgi:hypothetical protein